MSKKEEQKTETPPARHIQRTEDTRTLKCILTEGEMLAAGRAMADAQNELATLEADAENWKAQQKSKVAAAEGIIAGRASMIRSGYEFRPVNVEVVRDYDNGVVEVVRMDNMALVESRPMNATEKQMGLDLVEKEG